MLLKLVLLVLLPLASALHFYMDAGEEKCFYEDLAKDTFVVGHYATSQIDKETGSPLDSSHLKIEIMVFETFDNDHRVVNQKAANQGKFTFTTAETGEHRICFRPLVPTGWFNKARIRMSLDIAAGDTSEIDTQRDDQTASLAQRVRQLTRKVQDVIREQAFQRTREAQFRDASEKINAGVLRWSIMQVIALMAVGVWQTYTLRTFFVKQKLV
ncbi:hypothetical protein CANCADRAFT_143377 [Tortispora caseinolytica NRRL Y-17796]|uniref:GOLD domain-containing protein n=1 Tax=Tortispora caseinolytica NRRL Y-17796 TaxID=767744 RepID=A0A1E4TDH2_9ASCO|nr:hypothetical protein CANCADRAFT_143377 [Tortispora caseinolytica NRRL Y-17796]